MFDREKIMILDGGMGTLLAENGWNPPMLPEEMNLTNPDVVRSIHRAYIDAGADVIETNSFGGSALKLAHRNLQDRTFEINERAAHLAREAAGEHALVAGCAGPLGELLEPSGKLTFDEAVAAFKPQFRGLIAGGADFLLIETILDIREAKAAVVALKECDENFPFVLSFTFDQKTGEKRRTITGTPPEVAARWARAVGARAVGANCGVGPEAYIEVVSALHEFSGLPVFVYANAGLPSDAEKWDSVAYARAAEKLVEAGAAIVGGCCRTTPEHIRELKQKIGYFTPKTPKKISRIAFASRSELVETGKELVIIGERINASRPAMRDEILKNEWAAVRREAREQTEKGASLIDVNVGLPSADQLALMRKAVAVVEGATNLPISLDSDRFDVLEEGLRACSGVPLLNSVTAKSESLKTGIALAKKYGAVLAVLTLDENGIPESADARIALVERILQTCDELKFNRENVIIDALCMAVGADSGAPSVTLETLRRMSAHALGCGTMLGLSNVSHGMPARSLINRTWLAMAMGCGLQCAILSPHDEALMEIVGAGDLLRGGSAQKFIDKSALPPSPSAPPPSEREAKDPLATAIIQGDLETAVKLGLALDEKLSPTEVINNSVIPALERVGKFYDTGVYFLPQLIASANAAQAVCENELARISAAGGEQKCTIVLATVEGDLHDLGKNVVATMLRSHGYKVVDLGKDVPCAKISACVREENALIVGLSALMTGTMRVMEEDVKILKGEFPDLKITVGGAAVSEDFCVKIGADGYAPDAPSAVRLIDALLSSSLT